MPLSYDARSVFSLFSMKYMGSCPLNRNRRGSLPPPPRGNVETPIHIITMLYGPSDIYLLVWVLKWGLTVYSMCMWRVTVIFDPAFWKYEGAQAKIVVYYPRNEVKSCENSPIPNRE